MSTGIVTLRITTIAREGEGVGQSGGRAVHVPGTIPGERVEVRMPRDTEGPGLGALVRVIEASPHRVRPRCAHAGVCGGCSWQHIAYDEQLRLKQHVLQDLLTRALGRRAPRVAPTLATPAGESRPRGTSGTAAGGLLLDASAPWGYRNKVHFAFGPGPGGRLLVMGHYLPGSRRVLAVSECPVHAEIGNRLAFRLRDALAGAAVAGATADGRSGIARHVVVRVAEGTDEAVTTLVVTENVKALRKVTADVVGAWEQPPGGVRASFGFHLNVHDGPGPMLFGRQTRRLAGLDRVREQVAGVSYLVAPTAFFQTNVRAADVLVRHVVGALEDPRFARILDLYSGVGLFALPLARQGRFVTAIEENREAAAAAVAAQRMNGIGNRTCRVIVARVEDALPGGGGTGARSAHERCRGGLADPAWDAVVLDPPRDGCPPRVLDGVFRTLGPMRVVYVSCNPEALARDLARVPGDAYRITRVQPIDMFPHTAHVEAVAVVDRVSGHPSGTR